MLLGFQYRFKSTLTNTKFIVPKTHSKYEPLVYDRFQYFKYGRLIELDQRQRLLSQQYVNLMSMPALLFLHGSNLSIPDANRVRRDFSKVHIGFKYVNSRLFKSILYKTKYNDAIPLLNGPTYVCYPLNTFIGSSDPESTLQLPSEIRPVDTTAMVKDFFKVLKTHSNNLHLLGGQIEQRLYGPAEVKEYSQLPVRSELYGELLGTLSYPATTISSILQHSPSNIAYILDQLAMGDKGK